jgi:hypothetical protein
MVTTPNRPVGTGPSYDERPSTTTTTTTPRRNSSSWIGIIIGALVILGLIIWFANRSGRMNTASNTGTTGQVTTQTTPPATQPPATQPPATQPSTNP